MKPRFSDFWVLIAMALVLVTPFFLTLLTITQPRPVVDYQFNPTPYGYTWSLSLFIVPTLVLAGWLARKPESRIQNQSFWITIAAVAGCGILLDVFFGLTFFTFPNAGAVLGIRFYGFTFGGGWSQALPIEEIGFYIFGIMAILLIYIWGDEHWFGAYNVDDESRRRWRSRRMISFHVTSAVFGVGIFLTGLVFKKLSPYADHAGFPGYFLFLTLVGVIPSILFFPVARPYINWRAFSLSFLFILLVSVFWEGTIALPYQWWGFQRGEMLGVFINGFSGLPIEEPALWLGVTWATIIVYETLCTLLHLRLSD